MSLGSFDGSCRIWLDQQDCPSWYPRGFLKVDCRMRRNTGLTALCTGFCIHHRTKSIFSLSVRSLPFDMDEGYSHSLFVFGCRDCCCGWEFDKQSCWPLYLSIVQCMRKFGYHRGQSCHSCYSRLFLLQSSSPSSHLCRCSLNCMASINSRIGRLMLYLCYYLLLKVILKQVLGFQHCDCLKCRWMGNLM